MTMSKRQHYGTGDSLFDEWLQFRSSSTSFAATQQHMLQRGSSSTSMGPLDRVKSNEQVQLLLKLRRDKLNHAKRNGDKIESARLRNLNIFDEIEISEGQGKRKAEIKCEAPQCVAIEKLKSSREGDIKGHSDILCGYLKLQQERGISIPEEFSMCSSHFTPGISKSQVRTCDSPTRTSCVIGTELTTNREAEAKNSPLVFSGDEKDHHSRSDISPRASSVIGSEAFEGTYVATRNSEVGTQQNKADPWSKVESSQLPTPWSLRNLKDQQDPFLYEGLYKRRPDPRSRRSRLHSAKPDFMGCRIPMPHPKILAAVSRIEYLERCQVSHQLKCDLKTIRMHVKDGNFSMGVLAAKKRIEIANQSAVIQDLRRDVMLVEMYTAEMAKRCRSGVWWEGWIIVDELERNGISNSTSYIPGKPAVTV